MSYKMRVKELRLKGELANRSGFVTENMTSATPDNAVGTVFKNVAVNENGEFVVQSASPSVPEVYRGTSAPASPVTGWLWVDTSTGNGGQVLKQYNGTAWTELDRLSIPTAPITADTTLGDAGTLVVIDGNSGLPINITLPAANTMKGRRIEFYKYRGTSQINIVAPTATIINTYTNSSTTYAFKNTSVNYFMSVRSDGGNWIVDDDNIYNRVANTLFVDLVYGNNTYAAREFESRPFATVAAAIAASLPGDTIVLRNGNYAFGALILPHSLNFQAEEGANRASGELGVPAGATVSYNGGTLYRSSGNSNLFVPRGDNVTITGYVEEGSADGISLYNLGFTTAYTGLNLTFSVGTMKAIGTTGVQFYLSRNASTTSLTNCVIRYRGKYMERNVRFKCGDSIDTLIDIECDEYNGLLVGSNFGMGRRPRNVSTRNGLIYKGNKYYSNNITQPCFNIFAESYNFDTYIDVKEFKASTNIVTVGAAINANIYCDGDYRSTKDGFAVTSLQQSLANPSGSTVPLTLHFNVVESEVISVASKPSGAGYGISGNVIGLTRGTNAIITSKVLRSSKNEVIGIDHSNPQTIDDQAMGVIEIYGTKLEKLGRDVGAGYDGVIFIDTGGAIDTIQDNTIKLYNGVSFINLGDTFAIAGFNASATNSIPTIEYYDDIYTNGLTNNVTYFEKYMHKPSKTITAGDLVAGVYTVKAYENDLYYNGTLGPLTVVLPDPAKYINREIQFKQTGLMAAPGTLIFDPAGAALIDGAATYSPPNQTTLLTNTVIKSNGIGRYIK